MQVFSNRLAAVEQLKTYLILGSDDFSQEFLQSWSQLMKPPLCSDFALTG